MAEGLSEAAQKDVNSLINQLVAGNTNPGIGTRKLQDGFIELRAKNGGRVIIKLTSTNFYDVVGKFQGHVRGDAANSETIRRIINDYSKL